MSGWQDIATAPRDGTRIWLYFPERHEDDRQTVGWWHRQRDWQGFIDQSDGGDGDLPTHWQPLPTPPEGE